MKRLFIFLLLFLGGVQARAVPVSNPTQYMLLRDGIFFKGYGDTVDIEGKKNKKVDWKDLFSFRLGFSADYVFQRNLVIDRIEQSPFIDHTSLFTHAASLTLTFWDRLELAARLGATRIRVEANSFSFDNPFTGVRAELKSSSDFSWSLGARSLFWQWRCWIIGGEAVYFQTSPDISRITLGPSAVYPTKLHTKYREWQLSAALSRRFHHFAPYIAVKWCHAKYRIKEGIFEFSSPIFLSTLRTFSLENRKDVGFAVGVSITACARTSLTVEARFGDESALHATGEVRF